MTRNEFSNLYDYLNQLITIAEYLTRQRLFCFPQQYSIEFVFGEKRTFTNYAYAASKTIENLVCEIVDELEIKVC